MGVLSWLFGPSQAEVRARDRAIAELEAARIASRGRWDHVRALVAEGWRPLITQSVEYEEFCHKYPLLPMDFPFLHDEIELCRLGEKPSGRGRYENMVYPQMNVVDLWWRPVKERGKDA